MTPTPEFSFEVDLNALPKAGRGYKLEAGPDERDAVAKRLGVIAVDQLSGDVHIRATRDRFSVRGNLVARLKRQCVATLQEMSEEIDEPFELDFVRHADMTDHEDEEISLDAPECFDGQIFDLGEALVQQLSLAMAPFPRMAGADSLVSEFGADEDKSPFGQALAQAIKSDKNQ